jgi:hypothetical protein
MTVGEAVSGYKSVVGIAASYFAENMQLFAFLVYSGFKNGYGFFHMDPPLSLHRYV